MRLKNDDSHIFPDYRNYRLYYTATLYVSPYFEQILSAIVFFHIASFTQASVIVHVRPVH